MDFSPHVSMDINKHFWIIFYIYALQFEELTSNILQTVMSRLRVSVLLFLRVNIIYV